MYRLAFALLLSQLAFAQQADKAPQKPETELPATPKPLRVAEKVMESLLVSSTPAVLPALAQQAGVSGDVQLQILIGEDGTVQNAQLVSGHPLLVQAAIESVRTQRYKPTLLNGQPVTVITTTTVHF